MSQTNSNDTCDLYYALRQTSVQMSASRCLAFLQNRLHSPNPSVYRRIRIDIDICPSAGPFASCRALSVSHRYCTVRRPSASQKLCAPSPSLDRTFQRLRVSLALPVRAAPGCQNTQNMSNPRRPVGPSSPARDVTAMRDAGGAGCRCEQSPAWRAWPTGCGRISFFHSGGSQARPRGPQIGVDISPTQ